ncbi:MAG: capsule biosynthesis protein [Dinoroseobacter sp.]|nr:capsule biosynthesis protein [Dinoroseobacter sp.]MAX72368.1 capsule biosynthesis protein [Nioella sp.]
MAKPAEHSPPPAAAPTPAARPARIKRRHWLLALSFFVLVLVPIGVAAAYLWTRAADQYISRVGFSVRTEEASSAIELLGGITSLSGSSSSDTDILYEFLQSQELVRYVDNELDLRGIWSRVDPAQDPYFAYHAPGTIEDLVDHWGRQVRIYYDGGTGLIDLEILAFDPEDARAIAQMIFAESNAMINELSAVAREDAISYARDELEQAQARLTEARVALAEWRNENQTVDPTADTQGQMGLVTNLQAQLAEALIELDLLEDTARENDPRVTQAERRITVIEDRIAAERAVLGTDASTGIAFADLVGEYERLRVDQEFAEQAYTTALAAFDGARNEARRQSRYLAAHVRPTLAEASEYPDRPAALATIAVFLFLTWTVLALIAYSLRDRR